MVLQLSTASPPTCFSFQLLARGTQSGGLKKDLGTTIIIVLKTCNERTKPETYLGIHLLKSMILCFKQMSSMDYEGELDQALLGPPTHL